MRAHAAHARASKADAEFEIAMEEFHGAKGEVDTADAEAAQALARAHIAQAQAASARRRAEEAEARADAAEGDAELAKARAAAAEAEIALAAAEAEETIATARSAAEETIATTTAQCTTLVLDAEGEAEYQERRAAAEERRANDAEAREEALRAMMRAARQGLAAVWVDHPRPAGAYPPSPPPSDRSGKEDAEGAKGTGADTESETDVDGDPTDVHVDVAGFLEGAPRDRGIARFRRVARLITAVIGRRAAGQYAVALGAVEETRGALSAAHASLRAAKRGRQRRKDSREWKEWSGASPAAPAQLNTGVTTHVLALNAHSYTGPEPQVTPGVGVTHVVTLDARTAVGRSAVEPVVGRNTAGGRAAGARQLVTHTGSFQHSSGGGGVD